MSDILICLHKCVNDNNELSFIKKKSRDKYCRLYFLTVYRKKNKVMTRSCINISLNKRFKIVKLQL